LEWLYERTDSGERLGGAARSESIGSIGQGRFGPEEDEGVLMAPEVYVYGDI
jgi:hypothetical protein